MLLGSFEVGVVGVFRGGVALGVLAVCSGVITWRAMAEAWSGSCVAMGVGDSTRTGGADWVPPDKGSADIALVLRNIAGRGAEVTAGVGGFEGPFLGAILVYTAHISCHKRNGCGERPTLGE